ncbi:GNAT family acetyltransferase [Mesorhizobium sp. L103C119B0]|uniref:GNAT family N-acetyltransferase n=1 Tax=unclassified Mesorhizobium TaxID=325217 RepID=UPI0003D02B16|nr:GNAT family N-acetyltransferase [Mesorhizobium sp. L103C119B0]ESZ68007.1 GNAT family acetyltransferase [Mesorhizobium sp. L103C119B0]
MSHVLDRPVWSALDTRHRIFAYGDRLARRYPSSIVPFAASGADDAESLQALASDRDRLRRSDGCRGAIAFRVGERVQQLTQDDAAEMLALASLTKPGPFTLKALSLGEFWGVKIDGRLAAMAGERMKQPGYSELSGVCSHPEFRGSGLGRLLSVFVANRIFARGEVPYLHSYASNANAVGLYEAIGFRLRAEMNVAVVQRAG